MSPAPATEPSSKKATRALVYVGGALAVALLALWLFSGSDKVPETTRSETEGEAPADEPARQAAPSPAPPGPAASVTKTVATAATNAAEFPPSHPINEERLRMQRQNQFIQMMNDAMDLKDGPRLRELAKRFGEEKFDDPDKHGEGYLLVADCLEHPGEASRAAAQAFWDRERGSNLRRYVKRHCLE